MFFRTRKLMLEELRTTNAYLSLLCEVIQKDRVPAISDQDMRAFRSSARSVEEAAELLSRWLFINLPAESKEDLAA